MRAALDALVTALVATSLPVAIAGCGGRAASTGEPSPEPSSTTAPRDPVNPPPTSPQTPTPACDVVPPRSFSLTMCGEDGDRLRNSWGSNATRQVPCDVSIEGATACGYITVPSADCKNYCLQAGAATDKLGGSIYCAVRTYDARSSELDCGVALPGGRREEQYGGEDPDAVTPLGCFFSRLAQLETLSIRAFTTLAEDLRRLGAPRALIEDAMRARLDEVRHARVAWRLARRFGAKPVRLTPPRRRSDTRSLLDLAIENVQEGCIRETFGALAATYQARVSTDSEVREALAAIARDEAEHAALAWRIHAFCDASLDAAGRASVRAAMREGFAQLRAEIEAASGTPRDLERVAGVPPRGVALEALSSLEQLTASM